MYFKHSNQELTKHDTILYFIKFVHRTSPGAGIHTSELCQLSERCVAKFFKRKAANLSCQFIPLHRLTWPSTVTYSHTHKSSYRQTKQTAKDSFLPKGMEHKERHTHTRLLKKLLNTKTFPSRTWEKKYTPREIAHRNNHLRTRH